MNTNTPRVAMRISRLLTHCVLVALLGLFGSRQAGAEKPAAPARPGGHPPASAGAVTPALPAALPRRKLASPAAAATAPVPVGQTATAGVKPAREPAPIVIAPGPNGIVIASEDVAALNEFERLLLSLANGNGANGAPDWAIFYLTHAKAATVAETLSTIFGGGGSGGGSLLGDVAGAALGGGDGGGFLGSLLGSGGGGSSTTAITPTGSIKITPDPRLNALIVQANSNDLDIVEQLLKVLDQKDSPQEVLVAPKPRLIPIRNTQASEIAQIVREVYQDRMVTSSNRPLSPQEFLMAMRGGPGGPGGFGGRGGRGGGAGVGGTGATRSRSGEEPTKFSVGVDTRSNSLIVVATDQLFREVSQLVESLDAAALGSNQTMRVVTLHKASSESIGRALVAIAGGNVQTSGSGPAARGGNPLSVARAQTGSVSPAPSSEAGETASIGSGFAGGGMTGGEGMMGGGGPGFGGGFPGGGPDGGGPGFAGRGGFGGQGFGGAGGFGDAPGGMGGYNPGAGAGRGGMTFGAPSGAMGGNMGAAMGGNMGGAMGGASNFGGAMGAAPGGPSAGRTAIRGSGVLQ